MRDLGENLSGRLLGAYRLKQCIGHGGMSVVYVAEQIDLPRQVAVKILLPQAPAGSALYDEFRERFRREAHLIATLEHRNIVAIYEYKEQEDIAYLVMPYFPRGSLRHVLDRYGALSLRETSDYIQQAATALDYAHSHGVIHRDLKPSNFLIHTDGRLVLADFGIAYMLRSTSTDFMTREDLLLGTPEYVAPEIIRKESVDHLADIYELGIVLFQMLSGQVPFQGGPHVELLMKHLHEPLPLLHQINPAIPPAVDAVIHKATAKRREDRYRSAGDLAADLDLAINGPYGSDPRYRPTVFTQLSNSGSQPWLPTVSMDNSAGFPATMSTALAPQQPSRPPVKRFFLLATLGFLVLALVGADFAAMAFKPSSPGRPATSKHAAVPKHTATLTPRPSPTPDPRPGQAQAAVKQYYGDISSGDYQDAYQLRQTQGDYCGFVNSYASTELVTVTFDGKPQQVQGVFHVPITLHATEQVPSQTEDLVSTYQSTYQGYQNMGVVDGQWKIVGDTGGKLTQVDRRIVAPPALSGDTITRAQEVVQHFYEDINKKDYSAAYFLMGKTLRDQLPYCKFVAQYAGKIYAPPMFGDVFQQADGTVFVPTTVITEGATTNNTQWNYVVGFNNGDGRWEIMGAQSSGKTKDGSAT